MSCGVGEEDVAQRTRVLPAVKVSVLNMLALAASRSKSTNSLIRSGHSRETPEDDQSQRDAFGISRDVIPMFIGMTL